VSEERNLSIHLVQVVGPGSNVKTKAAENSRNHKIGTSKTKIVFSIPVLTFNVLEIAFVSRNSRIRELLK
jgi:hypothetical protein